MKKTKKDFNKFAKRNTHKRRDKDAARAELMRAVREVESSYSGFKIRDSHDGGRSARVSHSPHRDEIRCRGVFSSTKSGFGFVRVGEGVRDIFIPEGKSRGAIDGDLVEVIYHTYTSYEGEERTEGRIAEIVEYGREFIIGTLDEEIYRHGRRTHRSSVVIPDDPRLTITPYATETMGAVVGDKVVARLIRNSRFTPECEVTEILGYTESREANYAAILVEAGIPTEFTPEELSEASSLAKAPISHEGRTVFDDVIFTMDGEGAKDLDDAVSVRKLKSGYLLGVHIADVSEYVRERTPLDRCATSRGTSVYFVDKVVPMLPPALSNGACSLNSGEEKYALSALITLDEDGNILDTEICESVIKSSVRGVYSEVNRILSGEDNEALREKYAIALPSLEIMKKLYEKLLKKRTLGGYIDFDTDDAVIILDSDGAPTGVERRERGLSERIIEQFMLTANEAVACLLHDKGIPCVYRIHEAPPEDKFSDFVDFAHALGFDATVINKRNADAKSLVRLLDLAKERELESVVSRAMLRAMSKAKYSADNHPHFGLGIDKYCHFTSPIRRLSDLATHRIIKRVLIHGKRAESYSSYARRAAAAATDAEIRAEEAERKIENLYKSIYMLDHLGEKFAATVSSVTSFGLFCELENTCEGLVPMSALGGVFTLDEKTLTLRSRDVSYRIGDTITVMLEEVDVIRGKLGFSIAEEK